MVTNATTTVNNTAGYKVEEGTADDTFAPYDAVFNSNNKCWIY